MIVDICKYFQGYKSKVLVTEINNRYLNNNTKYEVCYWDYFKVKT